MKKLLSLMELKLKNTKFINIRALSSTSSMNNTDINKMVVSNKFPFGKKDLRYFIGYKETKTLELYLYSFQKCMHIEEILIKLTVGLF